MCILFLADREGRLWVGHENGLHVIEGGQARRYTVADGLPDNRTLSLLQTSSGSIWINSYGATHSSLTQFDGSGFHPVTDQRLSVGQLTAAGRGSRREPLDRQQWERSA